MSCGLDGVLAPLRAFALFLLGPEIRFEPLCSIGSAQSEPRMGHGLGQAEMLKFFKKAFLTEGRELESLANSFFAVF